MPAGKPRIKIHFTCDWCGCQFAADRGDYSAKVISWYKKDPDSNDWEEVHEYHTNCPICGGYILQHERDVEKWQYIPFEDGTESVQKVE